MVYEIMGARRIVAGENSIMSVPKEMRTLKRSNPFIVTDDGLVKAGLLNRLTSLLDDEKIEYRVFSEVESDPEIAIMEKAKKIFKEGQHDVIIALGGGSSIDTAKVISFLATNEGTVKDYFGVGIFKNDPIPVIAIPTTAGTGSEVTRFAIVRDKGNDIKFNIRSDQLYPKVAILDPTLLQSLPSKFIAYPGIDAFTHAIESFLSTQSNLITQQFSLAATRLIYDALIPFKENPKDTELASKVLYGSCLAGMAFTNVGLTAVHAMALPIGASYHLPHGLACALLLCNVLKENGDAALDKYVILLETLGFRRDTFSNENCTNKLIEAISEFMKKLEIPTSLRSMGVKYEVLPKMIEDSLESPSLLINPKKFNRNEIEWLLNSIR
jgi:alcohol dehydrogenase class IV